MTSSMSLALLDKPFENMATDDGMIALAVSSLNCPVAVLVVKSRSHVESINKVLFVYSGNSYESAALDVIQKAPKSVNITIFAKKPLPGNPVFSENVAIRNGTEESEEIQREYDLIVIGAEKSSGYRDLVQSPSRTPVLVIYSGDFAPLTPRGGTPDTSIEMQDHKTPNKNSEVELP